MSNGAQVSLGTTAVMATKLLELRPATVPPASNGLRWEEFIDVLATSYRARFE
jgi:hypothetical protein